MSANSPATIILLLTLIELMQTKPAEYYVPLFQLKAAVEKRRADEH